MQTQGEHLFAGWLDQDPVAYHAHVRPRSLACIELRTGERLDYADLDLRISHMAGWLTARVGDPLGARIAYLGRNSINQLAVMFACHRLGAIFAPLNWRLSGSELSGLAQDCDPALIIADAEFEDVARQAQAFAPSAQLYVSGGADLTAACRIATPVAPCPVNPSAPFILLYTSGTTGRPKAAVITRLNAFFNAFNFMAVGQVAASSVMLCDAPMFHTVGLMAVARTAMQAGAAMAISDRFAPDLTLWRLSDPTLGVTHYFAVPQIAQMLREQPEYAQANLSRLTALFTGGAPMPPPLVDAFLADGVTIANGYGMTEAGTVLCMPLDRDLIRKRPESSGLAAPAVELRIVRPDGTDATPGESGEIWLKGPGIMPGYWNRPEENAKAFVDGWFRSGDAGVRDEARYVQLLDRWKDMYITGGENVYPAEVEAVLITLPGVSEAAVVGVPDARWGEAGLAFVVADPAFCLDPAQVIAGCDRRLARYKHPRTVRIVEALPRTASGKVQKDILRAMALV